MKSLKHLINFTVYHYIYIYILTGSTSHIITVISLEPVASLRPSGENLQYQTSSQWSLSICMVLHGNCSLPQLWSTSRETFSRLVCFRRKIINNFNWKTAQIYPMREYLSLSIFISYIIIIDKVNFSSKQKRVLKLIKKCIMLNILYINKIWKNITCMCMNMYVCTYICIYRC